MVTDAEQDGNPSGYRYHRRPTTLFARGDRPPMSVTVRVPTTLRTLTAGASEVEVDGATVAEALTALDAAHPGFRDRLLDDDGNLRRFVNVFVADDDVRFIDGMATPIPDGETLSIIPAVAGG
jgi:molybdopterin converting factor small subunit